MSTNSCRACTLLLLFTSVMLGSCIVHGLKTHVVLAKEDKDTTAEFIPYNGSKFGMAIQYPKNWNITEDSRGVWFTSPADKTGNIRISSQPVSNASLAELVQVQLLQTKDSYSYFTINSSKLTTMAGSPANRTDYQIKDKVQRLFGADIYEYDVIQVSAIKSNRLYTFTYFSTPQNFHLFLPLVEKMLSTLKII
jgi:hypothetical protein